MHVPGRFVVFVLLAGVAAPLVAQEAAPGGRFEVQVTEEMIRHSCIRDILYFAGFAYGIGVLVLVLVTRISARLRDAAARVTGRPFVLSMIYVALLMLVTTVFELPLAYYSGFVVPHQFNLSNQTLGAWLIDEGKGLLITLIIGSILGALALLAVQRVKRWWLAIWIGLIPIMILLIVIAPVFLDPVFNDFRPLRNEELRRDLLELASRAGIEESRVYEVDKSRQTKTMNAYVTGIGPTKRIVMWDTLLEKMSHDEVLAVMGHEMGHYVLNHLWKGLAAAIGIALVILFLAQRVYERGVARWASRWSVMGKGDPASFPWLFIIVVSITFLLSPVVAGISRYHEYEADRFGLELTRMNEPMATAFIKLAEDTKINPDPHPFIEFWRHSHPSINKRIDFVLHYRPWEAKPLERIAKQPGE
ncbi:MAG TPA: M48 family metallopeptidase [Thermoanaerobaculia bacterium]|nr:M48 family metallopeptidase [Thermoanaerobaculia bacterium]